MRVCDFTTGGVFLAWRGVPFSCVDSASMQQSPEHSRKGWAAGRDKDGVDPAALQAPAQPKSSVAPRIASNETNARKQGLGPKRGKASLRCSI